MERIDGTVTQWRKQWSHKPTLIPLDAGGMWYSEECVDQMLAEYTLALRQSQERMRKALETVTRKHFETCNCVINDDMREPCDCGVDEARAALAGEKE